MSSHQGVKHPRLIDLGPITKRRVGLSFRLAWFGLGQGPKIGQLVWGWRAVGLDYGARRGVGCVLVVFTERLGCACVDELARAVWKESLDSKVVWMVPKVCAGGGCIKG